MILRGHGLALISAGIEESAVHLFVLLSFLVSVLRTSARLPLSFHASCARVAFILKEGAKRPWGTSTIGSGNRYSAGTPTSLACFPEQVVQRLQGTSTKE